MKRSAPHLLLTWLFSLLLRQRDKESLLGDLLEEHALLASSLSLRDASRWYREQLLRSVVTVIWANIRRGSWLKTLGAACIGYLAMAWLSMTSDVLMIKFLSTSNFLSAMAKHFPYQGEIRPGEVYYDGQNLVLNVLILAAAFPSMVLGGYLAACMRPGAPVAIAVISAIGGRAPWMQVALTVLLPVAALAGGRMRIQKRVESE